MYSCFGAKIFFFENIIGNKSLDHTSRSFLFLFLSAVVYIFMKTINIAIAKLEHLNGNIG